MARPRLPSGELGAIGITRLSSGRYQARATTGDDAGQKHRLWASEDTEEAARAELHRQARALTAGGAGGLSPSSTVAEAIELWLSQILTRVRAVSLAYSTYESYETTARVILEPRAGGTARPTHSRTHPPRRCR